MSAGRALLTRGRGAMYAFAGAVVIAMASGWARGQLLSLLHGHLVGLSWAWLRRVLLGIAYDLPAAVVTIAACLIVGRLMALRPVRAAVALVGMVWALDALVAALVSHDMRLWTDAMVLAGRLPVLAATVYASTRALARGAASSMDERDGEGDEDDDRAEDEPV